MIEDEFRTVCSYALVGYEGLETLRILGVEPSPIGPRVRWEAPACRPSESASCPKAASPRSDRRAAR